jgi:hypothetical protein
MRNLRWSYLLITALLTAGCVIPASGHTTTQVGMVVPGPEVAVFAYSSDYYSQTHYGAWRTAYMGWTPVTVYYYSGRYYRRPIGGARAVVVYSRGGDYFFPPRERAWVGIDARFDRNHGPTWSDYRRAKVKHDNGRRARGRP